MDLYNLKDFKGGWLCGDFLPTLLKTKEFEVAIKHYKIGQNESAHCHKIADEITIIVVGQAKMNDLIYNQDDVIFIHKGESTDFIPLTDTITCVIKVPSIIGDKYDFSKAYI
jgi:mannose-6-phosphate isomerase-like protein (cupin superfamily)